MGMETCLQTSISTNIEIYDTNGLICKTSNTLTNKGRSIIGQLLLSNKKIDSVILSEEENTGLTQLMPKDAVYLDIINYYSTISNTTGELTINIETSADVSTTGSITLNSIGLAMGDVLFSVANAGGIALGSNPISILYQIKIKLTQL
jgi:hypothetical protein